MAKTLIIVEDDSDKYIFEAIIRHINLQDNLLVTDTPSIEWKAIADESNALKPTALIRALKALKSDIDKQKYDKIGIIRDMDNSNKKDRLLLVNTALREAFGDIARDINDINSLVPFNFIQNGTDDILTVNFACYFVHLNNKGEIEDILKEIKAQPSPIADCVDEHLIDCLKISDNDELREKDLVKLWFNHYQRYDTLPKAQRKNPFTKTDHIMKHRTHLFDFDKNLTELNEIKKFLQMMNM